MFEDGNRADTTQPTPWWDSTAPGAPPTGAADNTASSSAVVQPAVRNRGVRPTAVAAATVALAVAGIGGGWGGARFAGHDTKVIVERAATPSVKASTVAASDAHDSIDVEAVVAATRKSVVRIQAQVVQDNGFFQQTGTAVGTGVIVSSDGYVVTNAHVVHNASAVTVALDGEKQPRAARVLAADPSRDLAVL